ncbi:unnamed protein product [Caenorhabditis auriculariae]|uniref:Uncharacterized protein n=1 Tax=Caenorhabditis auriculariae TaxID=2777116 RepID=A0A8S1HFP0_9PELO|nr:unnamed protein product [Caenorhabditis auriculariae]
MIPEIRAVVYDFGGVLLSYDNVKPTCKKIDELLGLPVGTVVKEIVGQDFHDWLGPHRNMFLGNISIAEIEAGLLVEYLHEKYSLKEKHPIKPYSDALGGINAKIIVPMLETVKKVREKGLKTGLLTNNMFLDKDGVKSRLIIDTAHFDVLIESCVEKVMKPQPEIYKMMEDRLGLAPNQILFLDDLQVNLDAAEARGWHTILVEPFDVAPAVQKLLEAIGESS